MASKRVRSVRRVTLVGMLSAVAAVLMFLDFSVPLVPSFLKMDLSEVPALIAAYAVGPLGGAAVCLVKNLFHLTVTSTGGVGELANFLMGAANAIVAGLVFKKLRGVKGATLGAVAGAICMAAVSLPVNYYLVYPAYSSFIMPLDSILDLYRALYHGIEDLWDALLIFNVPFTLVKGLLSALLACLVFKPIRKVVEK